VVDPHPLRAPSRGRVSPAPEVTNTVSPRSSDLQPATATPPPMPDDQERLAGFTRAFVTSIRHAVRNVSGTPPTPPGKARRFRVGVHRGATTTSANVRRCAPEEVEGDAKGMLPRKAELALPAVDPGVQHDFVAGLTR